MSLSYSRMMIVSCSASVALQILDHMSSREPTSEPMKRQQLRINVLSYPYFFQVRPNTDTKGSVTRLRQRTLVLKQRS